MITLQVQTKIYSKRLRAPQCGFKNLRKQVFLFLHKPGNINYTDLFIRYIFKNSYLLQETLYIHILTFKETSMLNKHKKDGQSRLFYVLANFYTLTKVIF